MFPCCIWVGVECGLLRAELGDETEDDDAADPHDGEDHGDAIEVAFRYPGCAEVGGDAATEHVRKAPTATAMKQDEQRQQETRNAENDLQDDLENLHERPFRKPQ